MGVLCIITQSVISYKLINEVVINGFCHSVLQENFREALLSRPLSPC